MAWFIGQDYSREGYIVKVILLNIVYIIFAVIIARKLKQRPEISKLGRIACDFLDIYLTIASVGLCILAIYFEVKNSPLAKKN